jgi:hypothetical protein
MVVYHVMWLSGLCVGVSRFSLLCFPAEGKTVHCVGIFYYCQAECLKVKELSASRKCYYATYKTIGHFSVNCEVLWNSDVKLYYYNNNSVEFVLINLRNQQSSGQ